jgi:hypothetical protein
MADLADHPFEALRRSESYVSPGEREWLRWVAKAEKLAGHDLDGNQDRDGYSLDYAYDAFCDGLTAADYLAEIKAP